MKKVLSLLLLIALVVSLVACAKNPVGTSGTNEPGNETTTPGTSGKSEPVQLRLWVHVAEDTDEGKSYAERVVAFNEAHEDIKATIEFIPRDGGGSGYEDKINTALTTNQLPDVVTLDGPNTAAYVDAGIIIPIDEYITEESKNDYLPSIIQQGTVNGKLYALGAMESTVLLFYNKDILAKYSIKPGTIDNPWTWDDLFEAAKKITEGEGYPALDMRFNDIGEWYIYAYAPFIWSNGGKIIGEDGLTAEGIFNSPQNAEALAFFKKLVDAGVVSVTPEENNFELGKSALYLNGPWAITTLENSYPDINFGAMPYPVSPKTKELHAPTGSWQYAVTSQSKYPREAAKLVEWMTNTDSVVSISTAIGMPPTRKSAVELLPQYKEGIRKLMLDQLEKGGHPRPLSVIYPIISRNFQEAVEAVLYGDHPQIALNEKAQVIEREAQRYK